MSFAEQRGYYCIRHAVSFIPTGSIEAHIEANKPCEIVPVFRIGSVGAGFTQGQTPTAPPSPPFRTLAGDGTVRASDYAIYANPAGSAMRIQLPYGTAFLGRTVSIKKIGTNARPVRIFGSLESGTRTALLRPDAAITAQSLGSTWRIV